MKDLNIWNYMKEIFKKIKLFYNNFIIKIELDIWQEVKQNNSLNIIILIFVIVIICKKKCFIIELNRFRYILILVLFLDGRIENMWRLLMFSFNGMIYISYCINWYNLIWSIKNINMCKRRYFNLKFVKFITW